MPSRRSIGGSFEFLGWIDISKCVLITWLTIIYALKNVFLAQTTCLLVGKKTFTLAKIALDLVFNQKFFIMKKCKKSTLLECKAPAGSTRCYGSPVRQN